MKQPIIFFGDKHTAVPVAVLDADNKVAVQRSLELATAHNLKKLIFPFQVHGTQGLIIQDDIPVAPFTCQADWVITNQSGVGVGVLTADCVPLLFYDPVHHVVGAVHAGWRGAVDGVVVEALNAMRRTFGSVLTDLQIWVGPHARTCCYSVDKKFYAIVMQKPFGKTAWHQERDTLFFDLKECCMEQLVACGIPLENVTDAGICTVCTQTYCSYRREKDAALRNISFIGIL